MLPQMVVTSHSGQEQSCVVVIDRYLDFSRSSTRLEITIRLCAEVPDDFSLVAFPLLLYSIDRSSRKAYSHCRSIAAPPEVGSKTDLGIMTKYYFFQFEGETETHLAPKQQYAPSSSSNNLRRSVLDNDLITDGERAAHHASRQQSSTSAWVPSSSSSTLRPSVLGNDLITEGERSTMYFVGLGFVVGGIAANVLLYGAGWILAYFLALPMVGFALLFQTMCKTHHGRIELVPAGNPTEPCLVCGEVDESAIEHYLFRKSKRDHQFRVHCRSCGADGPFITGASSSSCSGQVGVVATAVVADDDYENRGVITGASSSSSGQVEVVTTAVVADDDDYEKRGTLIV